MKKLIWPTDEKLRELCSTSKSKATIAVELGCSVDSLYRKLKGLGVRDMRHRHWSKFTWPSDQELAEMSKTMPFKAIARVIGCDASVVSRRAKRLGTKSVHHRKVCPAPVLWLTLPSYSELLGLLSNKSKKAVADYLGVDYALFLKETKRMGL